jgi:hypothetical protein
MNDAKHQENLCAAAELGRPAAPDSRQDFMGELHSVYKEV